MADQDIVICSKFLYARFSFYTKLWLSGQIRTAIDCFKPIQNVVAWLGLGNHFCIYLFIWVDIRLHIEFQLPVLFTIAVVGLNPIQ